MKMIHIERSRRELTELALAVTVKLFLLLSLDGKLIMFPTAFSPSYHDSIEQYIFFLWSSASIPAVILHRRKVSQLLYHVSLSSVTR